MKVSDLIADFFVKKEVRHVFGYIGGAITHIVDSIEKNQNIQFVQTYHEQTAAIAAEGYARSSKNVGVAMATSGPGATNLLTGVADAYFDSIPVIYITGQVNTYEYKYDKPIRQQGFQEMDVVSIVEPITKYTCFVENCENILYELEKAYQIAISGRPGPVLLDIPMNVQRAEIDQNDLKIFTKNNSKVNLDSIVPDSVMDKIKKSKRPVLLIGGGVKSLSSEEIEELESFLENNNLPVVVSLMGKGALNESRINFLGLIGSYGNRLANMSIANSDLLIAIGSRLDTRQTGASYQDFMNNGEIIQVNIDKNELDYHRISNKTNLNIDAGSFFSSLKNIRNFEIESWIQYLGKLGEKFSQKNEIESNSKNKSPYTFLQTLNNYSKKSDLFVADIGHNQMWSAQCLEINEDQNFYTSGGLAPMGFSMPFSVGLAFENKSRRIFSINGDGGFHMSTQSLMLISQYNLPVKVIVINNNSLGMITQFQGLYFNNMLTATTETGGYLVPDIEKLSMAYGLNYFHLTENDLNDNKLKEVFDNDNPCIIEFNTKGLTDVVPKLEYDSPIYNPGPKLNQDELENALRMNL